MTKFLYGSTVQQNFQWWMKLFYICVQYDSHWTHVTAKHLKCGSYYEGIEIFYFA